ncbi:hypothetical protein JVT61DRAFT_14456 [Boletus reticuloceps]|uniref:Uncharacterized protein n=1 Tax=Boletus reticuloceps TaxID=495285 RepID=A0A8I2YUN6_9AGAM|nr:hypothetical protein JVT61DRAFT_14456 [Boletus reticuloceps]
MRPASLGWDIILDVTLAVLDDQPILMTLLSSAVIMAISCFLGYTHSKLDALLVVFSVISFFIACDQYRRALVTWQAKRNKLAAIESNV